MATVTVLLVTVVAVPAAASPSPVSACPPCSSGFVSAAGSHGLETDVQHSAATVQVHHNGSATWTARVVPTNESALNDLAEDPELGRSVAADSFGVRYGAGIDHELLDADVTDGAFVLRYRTADVVRDGVLGTDVMTYFRDSPGAYIYTGLGADELTVEAPPGTTIARGFGDVEDGRLTATELPDVRDGPFVVFAPADRPGAGLAGTLAVLGVLAPVIGRNAVLFVGLPAGVLLGGLAGMRRLADATVDLDPGQWGTLFAVAGGLVFGVTVSGEVARLPEVTGNLFAGVVAGAVLVVVGVTAMVPAIGAALSERRLLLVGLGMAVLAGAVAVRHLGANFIYTPLVVGAAAVPGAAALGRMDAGAAAEDGARDGRLFAGLAAGVVVIILGYAPLGTLGGTLFLIGPIITAISMVGVVVVAIPAYYLGAAMAPGNSDAGETGPEPG